MALSSISRVVSSTDSAWTDLVVGPAIITSITMANTVQDDVVVSVRLMKGSTAALIVPNDILPEGGSYRLRLPAVVAESGDKLQVASSGKVDWILTGMKP